MGWATRSLSNMGSNVDVKSYTAKVTENGAQDAVSCENLSFV